MNVPTESEIKRQWWAEQPAKAQAMYRDWPKIGEAVFRLRGMIESVVVVKADGKASAIIYEAEQ